MLLGFRKHILPPVRTHHDKVMKSQIYLLGLVLLFLLSLHTLAMWFFEDMSIQDAVWLSLTTVTTVGYGDFSAQSLWGRVSTAMLLYVGGIAILAQVAALYFEYRQDIRNRMLSGEWSWRMTNHLVFLNCPEEGWQDYFFHVVSQLQQSSLKDKPLSVVIVSKVIQDQLPSRLRALNVVHVHAAPTDVEALEAANVHEAKAVVVLASHHLMRESDSVNFDLTHRLRELKVSCKIIAEVVYDQNRQRILDAGADHVIRPIRIYPELLVRTILAPGSEQVIEDLFNSTDEECIRYNVNCQKIWKNIVMSLVERDIGTPIAYRDPTGKIHTNPKPNKLVDAKALFVVIRCGNVHKDKYIQNILDKRAA